MMKMQVLEVGDRLWLVYEAISEKAALDEIAHARVLGSIGSSTNSTDVDGKTTVIAKVHRIELVKPS